MSRGLCPECQEYHGPTVARCPYEDPSYYEDDDDQYHECNPFSCDHESHEDDEPPNDDWIHEAYLRQSDLRDRGL